MPATVSPAKGSDKLLILAGGLLLLVLSVMFKRGIQSESYVLAGSVTSAAFYRVMNTRFCWNFDDHPAAPIIFCVAVVGFAWPLFVILVVFGGEVYLLNRALKLLVGGDAGLATLLTTFAVYTLGWPLLLVGLLVVWVVLDLLANLL